MRAAIQTYGSGDLESVLRVIDCAYAAACVETSWDRVLAEVCHLGGFGGCALGSIDPPAPRPVLRAAYGLEVGATTGGASGPMPRNPLLTDEVLRSIPGTVWRDRQIIPPAVLAASRFWTDWMQPQLFASWACIILGREGTEVTLTSPVTRPKWPLTGVYFGKVKPAWQGCYEQALTKLADRLAGSPRPSSPSTEPPPTEPPSTETPPG